MWLFLDFDGVLHPVGAPAALHFCHVPLLQRFLLHEAPHWRVVVSSSWREYRTLPELRANFSAELQTRIVGTTPSDDAPFLVATWGAQATLYPREIQIRHYLAQHGLQGEQWVALDDMGHWFRQPETNPNLVLCDAATGLTGRDLERLRQRI